MYLTTRAVGTQRRVSAILHRHGLGKLNPLEAGFQGVLVCALRPAPVVSVHGNVRYDLRSQLSTAVFYLCGDIG